VINTATNAVVTTVPTGGTSRYVAITPDGSRAYVSLGNSTKVISTASNTVTGTVTGGAFGLAFNPTGTRIYTADASERVNIIDTDASSGTFNTVVGNVVLG